MVEIKGKFITLTASLMTLYPEKLKKFDRKLFQGTNKHWDELKPEDWYSIKYYRYAILEYIAGSRSKDNAMITAGKLIYPTIKKTVGFPPGLKTPIDYLEFESTAYQDNIRGPGIKPRIFLKKQIGHVIIKTAMKEQDCKTLEGVYMGIMKLAGVKRGKVIQKKCLKQGDNVCEFHIHW